MADQVDRRSFLRTAGVAAFSAALAPWVGAQERRRPNFLFVVTDDQRWDAMGCVQAEQGEKGRFPWFKTPNMDRLAREGVRFRNAFVVNALCSPSRACYLTGQYSHVNGVANNRTPLAARSVTHASLLKEAGYVTGYFGKWHHGMQRERPGFSNFASYVGQGRFVDCPFLVDGRETSTQGWVDDLTTDYAIEFMRQNRRKPFCAVVGYKSPHGPRTPPARAAQMFAGEKAREVPNLETRPPYQAGEERRPPANRAWGDAQLNYFRTIWAVDENIGRVLAAMGQLGLADDTMVVFASDNGFYLGEHNLSDKRSAYEESIRIPLLVRWPGVVPAGKVVDDLVLNIDLAPTFLDYARVGAPRTMQGRSWRALLERAAAPDWRKAIFYEYFFERNFGTPTTTAVRTTDAKLIKYPGHDEWTELFDVRNDPYETKNLVNDPAAKALLERMRAQYAHQVTAVGYRVPDGVDKAQ